MTRRTLIAVVVCLLLPGGAAAQSNLPSAMTGVAVANSAAAAWAPDAELIYVENDESVSDFGGSKRWGYLYRSLERGEARAYSIQDGKVRTAETLTFEFDSPPLAGGWIDSPEALRVANKKANDSFKGEAVVTLRTMVLARGVLDPSRANGASWAVVFDSPGEPSLWVVVDAESGKVVKTWRG